MRLPNVLHMNPQKSSFGMTLCSSDVIENKSRNDYQITGFESNLIIIKTCIRTYEV